MPMMEGGPINQHLNVKGREKLPYPWNQEPDFLGQDRARLKRDFLEPFNEQDVCKQFKQPVQVPAGEGWDDDLFEVYRRNVGDFAYRVLNARSKNNQSKDIFFQLSKDPALAPQAELVFRMMDSPGAGKGFNLAHRIIKTQEDGISGTSFLKQAEAYLAILKKNNLTEAQWIGLESMQPNVTEFFLKNGYEFFVPPEGVYKRYQTEPDAFEMITFDFSDNLMDRDPVPILKDAFSDPDFMQYCVGEGTERKFVIDFKEVHNFDKYLPKAILGKSL